MRSPLFNRPRPSSFSLSISWHLSILSAETFEEATQDVSVMDSLARPFAEEIINLPPYAVGRWRGLFYRTTEQG